MEEEKKMKNIRLLEEGSFIQLILRLSLPAVFVILIMILYNMADTFFIGQTGNPDKISAISICMPIFTILSGIGTLFGVGGSTAISIALGEKNYHKMKQISSFCTFGCVFIGIIYCFLGFLFARPIAIFFGADEKTVGDAVVYLRTFVFASPFILFSTSYGNILRSDGEAVTSMISNMAGTLANIILDAIFIMAFHMDVFGAALASVIGNVISSVIVVLILMRKKRVFMPDVKFLSFKGEIVIPVLTLGLPMTFSTVLNSISMTFQNRLMMRHGSVFMAAQSVSGKLGMMITMSIMGICMGLQPAFSYNFGSKNKKRLDQILRSLFMFTGAYSIILATVLFFLRNQLVSVFINRADVISLGQVFVIASICMAPFYAVYQVCQTFLQSTGKASYAITVSLLDKGLVFIPVLFLLNYLFGAYGIAFTGFATMIPSVFVAVILLIIWNRKIEKQAHAF